MVRAWEWRAVVGGRNGDSSMTTFGRSRWSSTIKTLLGGFSGRAVVDRDGWGNKLDVTEAVGDPARLGLALQTQLRSESQCDSK